MTKFMIDTTNGKETIKTIINILSNEIKRYYFGILFFVITLSTQSLNFYEMNIPFWVRLLIVLLISILLSYFQKKDEERKETSIRTELDFQYKVIFNLLAKAIDDMSGVLLDKKINDRYYLSQLLIYIQKGVEGILIENNIQVGSLTVNLMQLKDNMLITNGYSVELPGRNHKDLEYDATNPNPGAPMAVYERGIIYIKDNKKKRIRKYFIGKPYRSFFSIPIFENQNEKTGRVIAVLNVDSSKKNQFVSIKFISEKIFPAINPFLTILQVLYNNNKVLSYK
jgi:hypothetical protein